MIVLKIMILVSLYIYDVLLFGKDHEFGFMIGSCNYVSLLPLTLHLLFFLS